MERKYDFDLLKGLEEVFLWTKSSGVLIEVAICSPGYNQLPSMNAFFVSISENPPLRCIYYHKACRYLS